MNLLHPKRHQWGIQGDIVTDKRRGQIWAFERHEGCDFCHRKRLRTIEIRPVWVMHPPRYKGLVIPLEDRISDAESVRMHVFETTPSEDIRKEARAK